jgi:hypothetical protein
MRPHLSGTGPNSEVFSFDSSHFYYKRFPPLLSVIFLTISQCNVRSRKSRPSPSWGEGKADVLFDESKQVGLRNLIFLAKAVEQRFGAVVLPHHD